MSRILVVGGSLPGIGQAITNRFVSNGEQVVGTYLTSSDSDEERTFRESAQNVEWTALRAETSGGLLEICQIPDVSAVVVAEFFFYMENPAQFDVSQWDLSLAVNLTLPKIVGHAALNNWPDCKSVVFVTSSEANTGSFGAHSYAATKAATHNLVKSLANVGGPNCRFNAVAAGWIGGVMDTDEVFNMSRRVTPLGRLGSPEEIAAAAGWLISEEASFVNGTTLYVDGGYTGVDTISKYEFENEFGSMSSSD